MSIFKGINISSSALSTQRLRMDVISANIANADTTRARFNQDTGEWEPYRRKMVTLQSKGESFQSYFNEARKTSTGSGNGVKVSSITDDQSPFKLVFDPTHPDANNDGYVQLPNVDPLKEMVGLISATRSYEANVTALNATKGMLLKALEIGK